MAVRSDTVRKIEWKAMMLVPCLSRDAQVLILAVLFGEWQDPSHGWSPVF